MVAAACPCALISCQYLRGYCVYKSTSRFSALTLSDWLFFADPQTAMDRLAQRSSLVFRAGRLHSPVKFNGSAQAKLAATAMNKGFRSGKLPLQDIGDRTQNRILGRRSVAKEALFRN